jgi:hypothetical protein
MGLFVCEQTCPGSFIGSSSNVCKMKRSCEQKHKAIYLFFAVGSVSKYGVFLLKQNSEFVYFLLITLERKLKW